MARTAGTRSTRISNLTPTGNYGTSSDFDGGNFEEPQDISDIASASGDIGGNRGTPPRRPPMGGIDLGKGLDLEKPRPPRSAIGIEIAKSPQGNLGIGAEIPIGISPFGARAGISIDPATGGIRGGYGGLGIGKGPIGASVDVGVDTPAGSEEFGCYKYVTVSLGPFSHTYGRNECEPKGKPPDSTPTPTPTTPTPISGQAPPSFSPGKEYWKKDSVNYYYSVNTSANLNVTPDNYSYTTPVPAYGQICPPSGWTVQIIIPVDIYYYNIASDRSLVTSTEANANFKRVSAPRYTVRQGSFTIFFQAGGVDVNYFRYIKGAGEWIMKDYSRTEILELNLSPIFIPTYSPPLPNPLPKKRMNNDCCKISIALQLETLRMLGREVGPNGLVPQAKKKGFAGEEIERIQTPIEDPSNPQKIKIQFLTIYDLLVYALKQSNNLDVALDPQSYKLPTGFLQNPKYNRDSEESLKSNKQPDKDKAGNKRELEINKDDEVKMGGFLQQQAYAFQVLRRFDYLFPYGELDDALVAKSLLIPGAKGNIKIHNMIHAYETLMQYLDAALGNPREILTIKDANPALEGDQPVEVHALSISDLLRQNLKFHIDTGGDVDGLVNLVLRDFRTNLANRIDLIKNTEMVHALFEDSGMLEKQEYIEIHLEGDPYAGQWVKGQGFKPNPELEKKTEEATEKVLRETMKPTETKIKVSKRSKDEKTDIRDLIRGLADFMQRLLSIPSAGDAANSINKLVESAKFKVQTEMALIRQNVSQAATASRNRTKKRKK